MKDIISRHELRQKVKDEEPLVRFETEKGKQMQVDWVEFPNLNETDFKELIELIKKL